VALIVIVIVVLGGIFALFLMISSFDDYGSREETEHFSFEVIIADGGHYKFTLGDYWDKPDEVTLSITSGEGRSFDVYIMDYDQYHGAYGRENGSAEAFSATYSKENVTLVDETIELPDGQRFPTYIVLDNRDTALTPGDAEPEGAITLDVHIVLKTAYEFD